MKRLPKKIDFGLAVVWIKQISVKEMREIAECEDDDPTPDGCWDAGSDTIYILRKLSTLKKAGILYHEIVHAAIDNDYWRRYGVA